MKTPLLLSAAVAFVLFATALPAQAQYGGGSDTTPANTRANRRAKADKTTGAAKAAPLFPAATRVEPKPAGNPSLSKQLNALIDLQGKDGSDDAAIAGADAILADPKAAPFDKSTAGYIAGYAWLSKETGNYTNATRYIGGAINDNGLSNNTHFQMMLQLAQMLESDGKHAEALTYLDRFLAETKADDPKAYNLRARILVGSGKPAEAAKALEALLVKQPNDKTVLMNLASVYQESDNDAKTAEIFERMHKAGLFTESKDYEMAFRLLANIEGHDKDAMALIDEGLQKGILKPSYEMYAFQGRSYYENDQAAKAIEAWSKAAPLGKDGEMYLNLGKLQAQNEKWADAKASAKSALGKGVKKQGEAWQVIASSEQGLGNKAAAKAAKQEAAKFPETRKWAEAALRQPSAK